MKKIVLDKKRRAFVSIEVEIEGKIYELTLHEPTGKQIKANRKLMKKDDAKMVDVIEQNEKHFFENLNGETPEITKDAKAALTKFYDENGDIQDFMEEATKALQEAKKKS